MWKFTCKIYSRHDIAERPLRLALNTNPSINQSMYGRIGGIMVSVVASSALNHGFDPRLSQPKVYKIVICCFSTQHATLRRKNKN